jgi:hypothetical protein
VTESDFLRRTRVSYDALAADFDVVSRPVAVVLGPLLG